jgi:outer membrane protein assembly factor BamA
LESARRPARTARFALGLGFAAAFYACASSSVSAQDASPATGQAEKKGSAVILPVLFYSPETRWGGGIGGIATFWPETSGPGRRPSSVMFSATVTENKQFELSAKPELYFAGDSLVVTGTLDWKRYPSKFYGIGNDAPAGAEEDFAPRQASFEVAAAGRIAKGGSVFAGLTYLCDSYGMLSLDPAGRLAEGSIAGSRGGFASGAGAVVKWDSRDSVFVPRRGNFFQISAVVYGKAFGSDFSFAKLKADLRAYVPVGTSHTLALQAYFASAFGGAPFQALPMFGSDNTMRGYYSGRFRDNHMAAVQAEYRLPLFWKVGLVGFAGAGRVAGRLGGLALTNLKPMAGWGVRFKVTREGANIRLDFGYGKDGASGVYFTAGEAF